MANLKRHTLQEAIRLKSVGEHAEAVELLVPLAETGDTLAQWHLADCMENGLKNIERAQSWYERASEANDPWFSHSLGRFYERTGNEKKAYNLVARLAASGYEPSIFRLGRYLELGFGTVKNATEGRLLVEKAANSGHVFAQRELAVRRLKGEYGWGQVPVGLIGFFKVLVRITVIGSSDPWDSRLVN